MPRNYQKKKPPYKPRPKHAPDAPPTPEEQFAGTVPHVIRQVRKERMMEFTEEATNTVVALMRGMCLVPTVVHKYRGKGKNRKVVSSKVVMTPLPVEPELRFNACKLVLAYAWNLPAHNIKLELPGGDEERLLNTLDKIALEEGAKFISEMSSSAMARKGLPTSPAHPPPHSNGHVPGAS